MTTSDVPGGGAQGEGPEDRSGLMPSLTPSQWVTFTILAGVIAATNIYSTLLIGWGDTGSIIAVLASVLFLGVLGSHRPSVHTLNLGQTMVSAGGSVGFAVASYAAVKIIDPEFDPGTPTLIVLFAAMGIFGSLVGSSVRKYMVQYFFPSGTACAVIQRSVTKELAPGERNRPVYMLKMWGGIAAVITFFNKVCFSNPNPTEEGVEPGHAWIRDLTLWREEGGLQRTIGLGVDPLYWGIGLVVGPRIGIGMVLGALAGPFFIRPPLMGTPQEDNWVLWLQWSAIAVLTLPTFATILFAYLFRTPPVIPPGFTPGHTTYHPPRGRAMLYGVVGALTATVMAIIGQQAFQLPLFVTLLTIGIAWPLCVVNGRVTGDTDINPVRLVAIVMLAGFAWLVTDQASDQGMAISLTLLGMAVIAGTLAAVAVDMMQDYRTGYLVDANPNHQTVVQFFGALVGAIVAIPTLNLLVSKMGIGADSQLKAPGAQVWAAMAETMAGESELPNELIHVVLIISAVGIGYAWLTVWPRTAKLMPSIFGAGIGMLVGMEASMGIFAGGLLKVLVTWYYGRGKAGDELATAKEDAGNDTMLGGASVFAAGAVMSIIFIVCVTVFDAVDWHPFWLAEH